jgi:hypothetical protein
MDMKSHQTKEKSEADLLNEDPLSGAHGAHPVATGAGAFLGGVTGAMIGASMAGPVGSIAGASMVGGALAGGLLGKAAGEVADPTVEDAYWRERHPLESYGAGTPYEDYEPAYRAGYEGFERHGGERFADVEADIARDYASHRAGLPWEKARPAAEAAWERVRERAVTGHAPKADGGTSV